MSDGSISIDIDHRIDDFELKLTLRLPGNGVSAIVGPSGAGKTTLLSVVAGLILPARGHVSIGEHCLFDSQRRRVVPAHRRRIGYVFQDARLFPHRRVRGNCEYGMKRSGRGVSQARFDEIVALLDIGPLLDRFPANLSGGERQRVAMARALLAEPQLLLLDEPLASLDRARRDEVVSYLSRLHENSGVPMLMVSHELHDVARLAHYIVALDGGRSVASGPAEQMLGSVDQFPVAGPLQAGAQLRGRIIAQHEDDRLSEVAVGGGSLWLPRIEESEGTNVTLRVRAADVILATSRPDAISANNVLQGTVADIGTADGPWVEVAVDCGESRLLASITLRSLRRLTLRPGLPIYAIVKSVSLA